MGCSGRAPAPLASEPCQGRQSQGARHVSALQHYDRRDVGLDQRGAPGGGVNPLHYIRIRARAKRACRGRQNRAKVLPREVSSANEFMPALRFAVFAFDIRAP